VYYQKALVQAIGGRGNTAVPTITRAIHERVVLSGCCQLKCDEQSQQEPSKANLERRQTAVEHGSREPPRIAPFHQLLNPTDAGIAIPARKAAERKNRRSAAERQLASRAACNAPV
jgi:hypothetical protein